ncbi:argininosuccinate synthase ArgG [Peptoclostridium acidaminophilum DSM 3953]|uniref:Argininosuccinate synthase n=1 Tax=Peptoclostridium acidaminophilum DSM 3953 TaxID=1286171 RepID=W8TJ34_PEPAC|nr:argininosuccinate synthase [Peptoclostridium acidaminophilum]AHM56202.1 argininosuccinate synthase ArgG [Peptoclostridium acidaminophilum DSM 3953]
MKEKVVLAYSGGLDTSIIIPWLKENYDLDIVAACINVGQEDDMEQVEKKAIKSGAVKVYVENVVEEFVKDYVFPSIKANAVYEDKYLMGTSIARPLIAKKLVEIAKKEGAKYIAHGCTGKGNDQVRFETTMAALAPEIKVIAPWRIWDIESREDAIDYANAKGIEIPVTKEKIYSRDMNLMHISHEGGAIEDPKNEQPQDLYLMTRTLEEAKDEPTYVEIYFEKGIPTKLDGKELSPASLLAELNKIGGENGIGVTDILENRLVGMKSRGIYETPGATILMSAHKDLEHLCLDKMTYQYKQMISLKYAELVYNGTWFCSLKEAMDAFIDKTQETVTGWVKLKLYKGNIVFAGMDSPYALYEHSISSFGASDFYNQKDATGFINLFNLPFKIEAMMKSKDEK